MGPSALEFTSINKKFSRSTAHGSAVPALPVLRDVNLTVSPSEFVCILGSSGCGKTTLIRLVVGLEHPDVGEIFIDGSPAYRVGTDVCLVFQNHGLFPWFTTKENVEYGLRMRRQPKAVRSRQADEYLEMVGLTEFANSYPGQLSGGMQQRAGLARALACEPRVMLMDEPFAAVDAQTRERLQDELLRLRTSLDMTIVFVTHSVDEAVYLSDRVVVMRNVRNSQDDEVPSVAAELAIDLPRPRDRGSAEFLTMVIEARRALEQSETK